MVPLSRYIYIHCNFLNVTFVEYYLLLTCLYRKWRSFCRVTVIVNERVVFVTIASEVRVPRRSYKRGRRAEGVSVQHPIEATTCTLELYLFLESQWQWPWQVSAPTFFYINFLHHLSGWFISVDRSPGKSMKLGFRYISVSLLLLCGYTYILW